MSFEFVIEGGKAIRLPTAGKYCDRDIIVTAEGGKEDLEAVLGEQEGLIDELREVLRGKAGGGGGDSYAKVYVTPTATTSITIPNPLGGLAKCFIIRRLSETTPSTQKAYECVGSYDPPLGAFRFASASTSVRYAIQRTSGSISNATFKITEGQIQVYRYNTANTWDTASEYEVEIFGRVEDAAATMMLQRDVEWVEDSIEEGEDDDEY